MALTKEAKQAIVKEVTSLLDDSKVTVMAAYQGTSVKAMQQLRRQAKESNSTVKVIKNRLVVKAIKESKHLKDVDTSVISGQLLYAFNSDDEVAPAQTLAAFAKKQPTIEFVGGITADGNILSADDLKALASLPSKDQLRGQLVGTISAPLTGFIGVMNNNICGVLNVLNARAEALK